MQHCSTPAANRVATRPKRLPPNPVEQKQPEPGVKWARCCTDLSKGSAVGTFPSKLAAPPAHTLLLLLWE